MEKVFFSHGLIRASRMRFAIAHGGHIRLKDGNLDNGSLIVEGVWRKNKAVVTIYRVEDDRLVRIGRDYEAHKKSAIYDVVKQHLLEMPNKMVTFAAEVAWRAIKARNELE